MSTRDLLHKSKLEEFKMWLISNGWTIKEAKGEYEVLRATSIIQKRPLIVYKKLNMKEHFSIDDRDFKIVNKFISSYKN